MLLRGLFTTRKIPRPAGESAVPRDDNLLYVPRNTHHMVIPRSAVTRNLLLRASPKKQVSSPLKRIRNDETVGVRR